MGDKESLRLSVRGSGITPSIPQETEINLLKVTVVGSPKGKGDTITILPHHEQLIAQITGTVAYRENGATESTTALLGPNGATLWVHDQEAIIQTEL